MYFWDSKNIIMLCIQWVEQKPPCNRASFMPILVNPTFNLRDVAVILKV